MEFTTTTTNVSATSPSQNSSDSKTWPSTVSLLSIDLTELTALVSSELSEADLSKKHEDSQYLSAAIEKAFLASDHLKKKEYAQAMTAATQACKRVEELYTLRKDQYPIYQTLQAPFYYLLAHIHTVYIEYETDAMGGLPRLEYEDEEQDEEEEAEDNSKENPSSQNGAVDPDEPRITEEIQSISTNKLQQEKGEEVTQIDTTSKEENKNEKEDEDVEGDKESKPYAEEAFEDANYSISLAIQIIEDFLDETKTLAGEIQKRQDVCLNLLVDCYNRRAELLVANEHVLEAIKDFLKVIELCGKNPKGNERIEAGANCSIGIILC